MQNTLKADRYKPTIYIDEKNMLSTKENKEYISNKTQQFFPQNDGFKQWFYMVVKKSNQKKTILYYINIY